MSKRNRNRKISWEEIQELFGARMPWEAAMLLFSDKPTEEIRAELRAMAQDRKGATSARDIANRIASSVANIRQGRRSTPCCEPPGEYDVGVARELSVMVIDALAAAGFRVIAPGSDPLTELRNWLWDEIEKLPEGSATQPAFDHVLNKIDAMRALLDAQEAGDGGR